MKKSLIVFFIILFIFLVIPKTSAQNISVDYPEKVQIGEEFTFKIKLLDFQEDTYDVKIDIFGNEKRISRILDEGKWKSTFYYIKKIIRQDEEKEFLLKIENYIGKGDIIIRIRDSNEDSEKFNGYGIKVVEAEQEQENKENDEEDIEEIEEETDDSQNEIKNFEVINEEKEIEPENVELEVIKLNAQTIKGENDNENLIKNNYPVYGFVIFCVVLGVLFIIKRNRFNKNEFR